MSGASLVTGPVSLSGLDTLRHMPQSMTNFDAALKDDYGPGLRNAINNSNPIFTEAVERSSSMDIQGRQAVWSVHTGRSTSTGARAELGTLPTADRQRFNKAYDDLASLYHTIKVSGQAKALTRNDAGSFVRALESEIDGAEKDLKNDLARQVFGENTTINSTVYNGVLAGASSNVTTVTWTFSNASASEMRYFWVNMKVDVIDQTTAAVTGTTTVSAVDATAKTVTLAAALGTTGDFLVRSGNLGNEVNGLRFLIAASGTYAGIASTVSGWAAVSVGSSSTVISEVLFDQAVEGVETDGDGSTPDLYIVEHAQRRKLASVLQAQKRYDGKEVTLKAGWRGLQIAQGTLLADRYCPTKRGFAITRKELGRFVGLDFTWDEDDGKVLYKALDGSDAVEARFKSYMNIEALTRNAHALITLAEPTF